METCCNCKKSLLTKNFEEEKVEKEKEQSKLCKECMEKFKQYSSDIKAIPYLESIRSLQSRYLINTEEDIKNLNGVTNEDDYDDFYKRMEKFI